MQTWPVLATGCARINVRLACVPVPIFPKSMRKRLRPRWPLPNARMSLSAWKKLWLNVGRSLANLCIRWGWPMRRPDNSQKSRSALEKAFSSLGSSSTDILLELARVGQEQKDYKGALGYLAHAEDLNPKDAAIPYYFGVLCLQMNLLAEAQRAMGKALALDPDNPSYNYSMGAVTVFSDGPEQAIPYFQKYLRLKPKDPRGHLALGAAYVRAKNYAAGLPMLRESAKHSETASTAHYYLGRILNEEGDTRARSRNYGCH